MLFLIGAKSEQQFVLEIKIYTFDNVLLPRFCLSLVMSGCLDSHVVFHSLCCIGAKREQQFVLEIKIYTFDNVLLPRFCLSLFMSGCLDSHVSLVSYI